MRRIERLRPGCHSVRAWLCLTTFLTTTAPALAEDGASPPPTRLDEVVVTAPRLDDTLRFKRLYSSDSATLLRDQPGMSLYTMGGVSSLPVIHGMADDRVKVQVDGMETTASCPNHMNPPLSYIDAARVAKVNVMAGITPVSAGGDSIGGTVAVESAKPVFAGPGEKVHTGGSLSTTYRSTNHNIAASGDVAAATENVSLGYAGAWTHAGDYHRGGDGAPVLISRFQAEDHAVTAAVRNDDHQFALQAGRQFIPYEGYPNQRMDLTENESWFANSHYEGRFGWGTLDARAYWRDVRHEMDFLDKIKGTAMPMDTKASDIGYALKGDIPLSQRDTLRVGNEFHRYRLDDWWPPVPGSAMMGPNTFRNIQDGSRDRLGTFAEWEAAWDAKWTTLVGVRNDTVWMDTGNVQGYSTMGTSATEARAFNARDHARTDVNIDLTALAHYEADKTSMFEAGYARKTRSPNLYERYAWSSGSANMNNWFGDGNGYVGDLNLSPEEAHTVSVSADWHDASGKLWGIKVTPYYTYVQDYIDADIITRTSAFQTLRFANHDAELYGLDIAGNLELWDAPDYGRGVFKSVIGLVRGRNLDTGDNLYNIMPVNGRFAVEHQLGGWSNAVDLKLVAGKHDVSSTRHEIKTPGYALVGLRTAYRWENVTASLGIENLFDRLYHEPLGGADLSDTGKAWGTGVPGAGRSYVAGMTVTF